MKTKYKKLWLAGLLSLVPIMGLGYIYIGNWRRFAVVFFLQLFTLAPMTWLGLREYNGYLLGLIWLLVLFDVYKQTKAYNAKLAEQSSALDTNVKAATH